MSTAKELRKNFNRTIRGKILIVFAYGYLVLALLGFITASLFVRHYLTALINSQNYSIAVQEWRGVANGIKSGWNFYPQLDGICIISNHQEILESQGVCPGPVSLIDRFIGNATAITHPTFEVRAHLHSTLWMWALAFPFIVVVLLGLFFLLFRRTFALKNQLEIVELFDHFDSTKKELTDFQKMVQTQTEEILDLRKQALIAEIASQVSHDIKSPLAALEMVVTDLTSLPEEKRIMVRSAVTRIKDIANNLLQKNREAMKATSTQNVQSSTGSTEGTSPQLLSSQIESIISEKRLQFSAKSGIEIIASLSQNSLGSFTIVQPTEFKRLMSNLLNNAVEILGDAGKVEVTLSETGSHIEIRVIDNGKGIPPEILKKLGQRGETHGKAEGSGLGLYHAKTSIEAWGGSFRIESELGRGTSVIIDLPKTAAPNWFVPELKITAGADVVVMDDGVPRTDKGG